MKQKTSFFNWGLCRSWLKRCWPLWAVYLALCLFTLPQSVPEARHYTDKLFYAVEVNRSIVAVGISMAQTSIFVGIIAAMVMYSYMYSSRTCGMMNALPMRRETVFTTAFITGLAPFIIADIIAMGAAWALYARTGVVEAGNIFLALGYAVMGNTAFYGFAVFCAVLTGNLVVLPAVYLVLGCTAAVVEVAVHDILGTIVYGYQSSEGLATVFSPIIAVMNSLSVSQETRFTAEGTYDLTGRLLVTGTPLMAAYCAAGLILSVCALLIYRRRDMERAGDVVAVPVLKPIFKYCMTFGCALVLAVSPSYIGTGTINASGMTAALTELALLLAGAFVGYFAAEMLMQKTLRVFRGHWCGFIVSGVIIIALTMSAELDLTGYERRTPAAGDVEWVRISNYSDDGRLSTPENIAAFVDFHREIIANKPVNEAADDHNGLTFEYRLKNGKIMMRAYNIAADAIDMADPYSNIRRLGDVMNLQEAVDYRIDFAKGRAVTSENVEYASIDGGYTDENGEWQSVSLRLTPEQAAEFYNECVVPDSKDSHLGHVWPVMDDEYFDTMSYLGLQLELRRETGASPNVVYDSNIDYVRTDYTYINLTVDAARCVKWLEENSDIRLMTLREADPESAEAQLQWNTVTMAQVPTRDSSVGIIGGADGPTAIFIS